MSRPYASDLDAGRQAASRYRLAYPRGVTSGLGGARLGRRAGSSLEFQEYREYRPGDDLRHLDWSAYGRSDRLVVKLFREEVEPHVDLVIDGSRSMAAGIPAADILSGKPSAKASATAGLAAFVEQASVHAGFSRGSWLLAEGCQRMAHGLETELGFEFRGSFSESVERLPPSFRPRGLRILISDLLWEEPPRAVLSRLARGAAALVVIQLLSREDVEPRRAGYERLIDAETGETRDLLVDEALVSRYQAALEEHQRSWREACRATGAVLVTLVAEEILRGWPAEALRELVESEVLELR